MSHTTPTPSYLTPRQAMARFYALPRALEALRLRGIIADRLAAALFPEDESTAGTYALGRELLAEQRATIQGGPYRAAPGSSISPTPDTPLYTRGQAVGRFIDDEVVALLHALRRRVMRLGRPAKLQVVDLSCGLSTRPWSLPPLPRVAWFDVDSSDVLELKAALLSRAGAQLHQLPVHVDLEPGAGELRRVPFPLQPDSWTPVEAGPATPELLQRLRDCGWDPEVPTVWLAVELLYYLPKEGADAVMRSVAGAARGGAPSALVATVMNQGMISLINSYQEAAAEGGGSVAAAAPGTTNEAAAPSTTERIVRSDQVREAAGVQFGVERDVPSFLAQYGWDHVEEVSVGDVELAYGCVAVGLNYPQHLRDAAREAHGHEPACCIAVARSGF